MRVCVLAVNCVTGQLQVMERHIMCEVETQATVTDRQRKGGRDCDTLDSHVQVILLTMFE